MNLKNIINEINISNSELRCELVDIIKNDVKVIRCNLNTEDDVDIFFALFKEKSVINWIVQGQLNNPVRCKKYIIKYIYYYHS
jgi:hypothetical protein